MITRILKLGDVVWVNTTQAQLPEYGSVVRCRVVTSSATHAAVTIGGVVQIVPLLSLYATEAEAQPPEDP